ncbi:MAG: ABC transporter permease subunit [Caldilineaceae bacterium]
MIIGLGRPAGYSRFGFHEAAEIDGANWGQKFRHVTLPLMTPTIFFTLVLGIIGTFQVFDVIFVLTDGMGGPTPRWSI